MTTMFIPRFMVCRESSVADGGIPDWDHVALTAMVENREKPVRKTAADHESVLVEDSRVAMMFSSEELANKFVSLHPDEDWKVIQLDDDGLLKLFDRPECLEQFDLIAVDHVSDQLDILGNPMRHRRCLFEPKSAVAALKKHSWNGQRSVEEILGFVYTPRCD